MENNQVVAAGSQKQKQLQYSLFLPPLKSPQLLFVCEIFIVY